MGYTRNEILEHAVTVSDHYERIKKEGTLVLRRETIEMIANAENLAEHAAQKDMYFTAITLLTTASRMNRKLIWELIKL